MYFWVDFSGGETNGFQGEDPSSYESAPKVL